MMVPVLTAYQHHRIAVMLGLFHMRGNILHIQPDAAVIAAVRHRGMQGPAMMERGLARLQRAENGLVLIDSLHRLALQQNIGVILGRLMIIAAMGMAPGQHPHAAADIIGN